MKPQATKCCRCRDRNTQSIPWRTKRRMASFFWKAVLPPSSVKDYGATLKNTSDAHSFLPSAHTHRTPSPLTTPPPQALAQQRTTPSALPDEAFFLEDTRVTTSFQTSPDAHVLLCRPSPRPPLPAFLGLL